MFSEYECKMLRDGKPRHAMQFSVKASTIAEAFTAAMSIWQSAFKVAPTDVNIEWKDNVHGS